MNYRIKPKFLECWGADSQTGDIVSMKEIETLAIVWNVPVSELMEQVDEVKQ